ncbi:uncharacterized protein CLUP02_07143 [Colletotrichum lupini]|uniref:Uncharacterized protein n=1 Tax=Colletotrichum lupini TaxID=145971 RepID=A0A9Q8SQF4_9PEZI|nr:uncharacterized protein CLUP02_07143 [Colletotrichum lupini]UQC81657.1 hypothetical protein CLUP02_07143 [Colletotrichum lupini]
MRRSRKSRMSQLTVVQPAAGRVENGGENGTESPSLNLEELFPTYEPRCPGNMLASGHFLWMYTYPCDSYDHHPAAYTISKSIVPIRTYGTPRSQLSDTELDSALPQARQYYASNLSSLQPTLDFEKIHPCNWQPSRRRAPPQWMFLGRQRDVLLAGGVVEKAETLVFCLSGRSQIHHRKHRSLNLTHPLLHALVSGGSNCILHYNAQHRSQPLEERAAQNEARCPESRQLDMAGEGVEIQPRSGLRAIESLALGVPLKEPRAEPPRLKEYALDTHENACHGPRGN